MWPYVLLTYLFANLIVGWFLYGRSKLLGDFPWFVFPLLGWVVGLAAYFLWVFGQIKLKVDWFKKNTKCSKMRNKKGNPSTHGSGSRTLTNLEFLFSLSFFAMTM